MVAVESDPAAVRTLSSGSNRRFWRAILSTDVHDLISRTKTGKAQSASKILEAGGLRPGQADLLVAGPPCQPFSKSGFWATNGARRLLDPRAATLDAFLDVLALSRPRAFLLENVPGISFSDKDDGLLYLKSKVKGLGYSFYPDKLNAAGFGVPQTRERVFVVGCADLDLTFNFPAPTHALPKKENLAQGAIPFSEIPEDPEGLQRPLTAWDAIGHLEEEGDAALELRGKWRCVLPTIPEGANYLWHTHRGGGIPIWGWRTRYWSMLLKLAKCRPSWTLTAQPGPAIGPFHWLNRRLSRREMAAIQTFPEDYEITGSNREAQVQLGNAVPSALAEAIGLQIKSNFFQDEGADSSCLSLLPRRHSDLPPPEKHHLPETLPPHIRRLARRRKSDHPGVGRGPGARKARNTL